VRYLIIAYKFHYICYVLGLLVHRNVDAEFDRKVFLVDCLL